MIPSLYHQCHHCYCDNQEAEMWETWRAKGRDKSKILLWTSCDLHIQHVMNYSFRIIRHMKLIFWSKLFNKVLVLGRHNNHHHYLPQSSLMSASPQQTSCLKHRDEGLNCRYFNFELVGKLDCKVFTTVWPPTPTTSLCFFVKWCWHKVCITSKELFS